MTGSNDLYLVWAPRVLGIAVALFVGVFALDAFGAGQPLRQSIVAFAVHLIPSLLVLAVVAVSWHRAWLGGILFVALAAAYGVASGRPDWILVISGPLLAVALLYFWSWRQGMQGSRVRE